MTLPILALDRKAAQKIGAGASREELIPASPCPHWIVWPAYYHQRMSGALPDVWIRRAVYDRLLGAAQKLAPDYRLVLLDGWRSEQVQNDLFYKMRKILSKHYPGLPSHQLEDLTITFANRASADAIQPSPHLTGGAVDVTLADSSGRFLDMGSHFDEPHERSRTDYPLDGPPSERRKRLLVAMTEAGFTNLPSEWWHFDFGNWIWAWYRNEQSAIYGPASLSSSSRFL